MQDQAKAKRVIELSGGVATNQAAKLLAEHGADVVKVEPPEGDSLRMWGPFPQDNPDPEKSGLFMSLNSAKRSVTLDLPQDRDQLDTLFSWADIVIHGYPPNAQAAIGLDPEAISRDWPSLVVLCITPFGITGPHANYQATELILTNAGGWANFCPATHTDPNMPPLKVYGEQCALMAGISGAMTALATLRDTQATGYGEYIDLSIQEYVASVLEIAIPAYSYKGEVAARFHQRSLVPWRIFNAKDGPVFIVCVEQDQWQRLVEFMGHPDWAELDIFADQPSRAENQDLVHTFVQEFVGTWSAQDLFHAAQKHRFCVAPVLDMKQFGQDRHLRERGFFMHLDNIEHLAPAILTQTGRATVPSPAPTLGQHNSWLEQANINPNTTPKTESNLTPNLPLTGVRVLDLSWAWAGPFCAMNLAHLGAEVIRIESDNRPDLYRRLPVSPQGLPDSLNISGMFNQWNQGKSSINLNLGTEEGIDIVKALVQQSDVVVQNFATGVMQRLGLGYSVLHELNPKIILASISGYGQTGPYREYMGYGPAIPPLTGLSASTGYIGGGAEEIGVSMPDPTAGVTAAWAVVSALDKVNQTGQGDHLDVSLWEATAVLNAQGWLNYSLNDTQPKRIGNRSEQMSPHGVYRCSGEDHWLAIACQNNAQWQVIARLIDPQLSHDTRFRTLSERKQHEDELDLLLSAWCLPQDRWQLTELLQANEIAAFPTLSGADIVNDKHMNQRGFIERLDHQEVGVRAHTGMPWRLDRRPNGVKHPAPCIGADTQRHLKELLNYTDADIELLQAQNTIG